MKNGFGFALARIGLKSMGKRCWDMSSTAAAPGSPAAHAKYDCIVKYIKEEACVPDLRELKRGSGGG